MKESTLIIVNGGYIGNTRPMVNVEPEEKLLPSDVVDKPYSDREIQRKLTVREVDEQIEKLMPPGLPKDCCE